MMSPEVLACEAELQSILERAGSTLQATKGALYLQNEARGFELVARYGFNIAPRRVISAGDVIVDRLSSRKNGYCVNGQTADPKFYEILYHTSTDRILVMPVAPRGQLVGFLDLRDKEARQPFVAADFIEAKELADRVAELLAANGLFGLEKPQEKRAEAAPADSAVMGAVERARGVVERTLQTWAPKPPTLTEPEIAAASTVLPSILTLQGAVIASFSAFGHLGNIQHTAARSTVSDEAAEAFEAKLAAWLKKQRDIDVSPSTTRIKTLYPFGESSPPITAQQIMSVLSAPVAVGALQGLVLTVAFERSPDSFTRHALEAFLPVLQQAIQHSMSHLTLRTKHQKIAEKLLEPDFQKFPELADHSRRVASLADQFGRFLKLPLEEVEKIRLAATLHDVGFRLLDYRRLYTKKTFNEDDQKLAREHPVVGAALIVDSPLGEEIANLVLCHHERPDGKGYPYGLAGEQIPFGSRVIQLCEAFDAMTALQSYQEPIAESAALVQITRAAGAQFDVELARKFVQMLQSASAFGA